MKLRFGAIGVCLVSLFVAIESAIAAPAARIIEVKGKVEIQRQGSSKFSSVGVGALLFEGDLVRPASDANVRVVCSDNKIRKIGVGLISGLSKICPQIRLEPGLTLPSRGEDDFLKYIDRRFYTFTLLDSKQPIRWQEVNGAREYSVLLGTSQKILIDLQVGRAEVRDIEALELGVEYNFQATALGDPAVFRLRFKVLTQSDREQLIKKIPDFPAKAMPIALADIYGDYDLAEQAIAVLEKANLDLAIAERMLGDFSLQVGLRTKAQGHYQKALRLALVEENLEVQAEAQVGLAKVFVVDGNKQEAGLWLQKALASYEVLEDKLKIEQVKGWLKKLS